MDCVGRNKRVDTDGDGMPDAWEEANGTDPNKNDAMAIAANGYANIENYINSITRDDRDYFLRAPLCLQHEESTQNSITVSWLDYSDNEDGFIVELEKNGAFVEVGRTAADASVYTVTDESLEPAKPYNIRVRAFAGENVSEYSNTLTAKTRPVPVEVVDIETFAPDYTWAGGSGTWSMASTNWTNGGTYTDGKNVLIAPAENINVDIAEAVSPSAVVVNGMADVTLGGAGAIAGAGSLNKAGSGTLVVKTPKSMKALLCCMTEHTSSQALPTAEWPVVSVLHRSSRRTGFGAAVHTSTSVPVLPPTVRLRLTATRRSI